MNDSELLHAWSERRDEAAFAELVRRHLGLVHASARRQVGASPLADDVAQAVFLLLARKAGSLGSGVVLSGWLFRTTRFVAARALRAEQRRSHHESLATMQPATADAALAPEHWKEVEPHLDGALASLSSADRDAVLLRYFEGKPLRTVGEQLGVNEGAAKKRVSRAVDKLRSWLTGRGVVLTAAGLTTVLCNLPASAAPSVLVAQIAGAATANTAGTTALSLAKGAARDWWLAQVRRLLPWAAAALLLLCVGGAVAWHRQGAAASVGANMIDEVGQASVPAAVPPLLSKSATPAAQPGPSKILLSVRSAAGNRPLVASIGVAVWGKRKRLESVDYQTDANGVVEIPVVAQEVSFINVSVSAPGFVPKIASWKRHEFVEPVLFHQCLLDAGQVLEGTVQDEAGNPVADARVFFHGPGSTSSERENVSFSSRMTSLTSDARGHFRSDQIPVLRGNNGHVGYAVVHADFVRGGGYLDGPASLATNHVVVLRRGERIVGRIEDSAGNPIPDATIEESGYYSGGARKTTSGSDGRFSVGPFSKGTVKLEVSADGFKQTDLPVSVEARTNLVVRLSPADGLPNDWEQGMDAAQTVRLTGTVVDDETRQPLSKFRIRLNEHRGTTLGFLGEGHDGRFDWPVDMAFYREFSLEADSDGYETAASDVRPVKNGEQGFEFRLKRGGSASGRVVDSSGNPVAGAVVGLNGLGFGFIVRDNRTFSASDAPHATTDADGLFSVQLRLNTESLVIVHEAGFAQVPVAQAKRATIALQPWGAIEGVVFTAGRPAANQRVILQTWASEEDGLRSVSLDNTTLSDAEGRFRFDHVPPGAVAVSRYYKFSPGETGVTGIGPRQRVEVPAGGMVEVTLVSTGRAVIGRFALSEPIPGHDWRLDMQKLEEVHAARPAIVHGEHGTPEFFRQMRADAIQRAAIRSFYPEIRPDGSFCIEDVPAGNYILDLRVSTPPTDSDDEQQTFFRPELGTLKIPVAVSDGDFNDPPLDLGTITIPVKKP